MISREITEKEIETFEKDGVVFLADALAHEWVQRCRLGIEEISANFSEGVSDLNLSARADEMAAVGGSVLRDGGLPTGQRGRFFVTVGCWKRSTHIRDFIFDSPLPELVAKLFRTDKINLYDDQILVKEPGAAERTAFHQDQPYFHIQGTQVCAVWVPVDVVTRESGSMGYVRGSHKWGKTFKPNIFIAQRSSPGLSGEDMPDIEASPEQFDIAYHDAKPGDVIVHHYQTLHGANGNTANRTRRALSARYCGADARYLFRDSAPPQPHHQHELKDGDPMDSEQFPQLWPRPE